MIRNESTMYVKPTPIFTCFFVCSSTLQYMDMQTSANIEKNIVEEEHLANWQTSEEHRLEISNPKPLAIKPLDEENSSWYDEFGWRKQIWNWNKSFLLLRDPLKDFLWEPLWMIRTVYFSGIPSKIILQKIRQIRNMIQLQPHKSAFGTHKRLHRRSTWGSCRTTTWSTFAHKRFH